MIAGQGSFQGFQPVARRNQQVVEPDRDVQVLKFTLRHAAKFTGKSSGNPGVAVKEQIIRQLSAKRDNHVIILSLSDNSVKAPF